MDKNGFVKSWDGNWYPDIGVVGVTGCPIPFSHSQELNERESPDYSPTDYIEASDEPINLVDDNLIDWEWE